MQQLFRDPALEAAFQRDGYVVVPFLDASALEKLRAFQREQHPDLNAPFHLSLYSPKPDHRRAVSEHLKALFAPRLAQLTETHEARVGFFIVKNPSPSAGAIGLHQDAMNVDEPDQVSLNVWCPLVDVTTENGCLGVVPGSHRWLQYVRPLCERPEYFPFRSVAPIVHERFCRSVPMPAGDAVIYHGNLIHSSPLNRGTAPRPVAFCTAAPAAATLRVFWRLSSNQLEHFEVDDDFFLTGAGINERPKNVKSLGIIEWSQPQITEEALTQLIRAAVE